MADLRIADAPELDESEVQGGLKIPTGGFGNKAINMNTVANWVVKDKDLPSKDYVDDKFNQGNQGLAGHVANKNNPHEVTKEQVGLGSVDNTADADKPISNATSAALNLKADKTQLQGLATTTQLDLKADISRVDTIETYLEDSKALSQYDGKYEFDAAYAEKIGGYPLNARLMLSDGSIVQNTVAGNMTDPNVDITGWEKGTRASDVQVGDSTLEVFSNVQESQLLTTEQFQIQIPEFDDTGRLQRAFDASFDRQQKLHLVGDFNCSDTIYARHSFDGSSSTITYPKDYNKDMLVFAAEKSVATTTRITVKQVQFPKVLTSKTSSSNDWTSNAGSRAITIVNAQECKFYYQETAQAEFGIYLLAYNTDSNYNQHHFCRHAFHKRPFTSHADGTVSVASMNQNIYNGGRFAVSGSTARVSGIYLMHFLITGGSLSSINNNTINNPSVEGSSDEYAILFEVPDDIGVISYNIITAARLENGNVENKKIGLRGSRTRWNKFLGGYGVEASAIKEELGANGNSVISALGAIIATGSLNTNAAIAAKNNSSSNAPTFAIFAPSATLDQIQDAASNSVMYCTSQSLVTRSATAERFRLLFNNGRFEWSGGTESGFDTNLYRSASGKLKTDGALDIVGGFGVFGKTAPTTASSITGKKVPTTIEEQNAVLDSVVSALVSYGLVVDNRAI